MNRHKQEPSNVYTAQAVAAAVADGRCPGPGTHTHIRIIDAHDLVSTKSYQVVVSPVQGVHNTIYADADKLR
jgi:hypothetical protein